jgi:hypothetical protein
VTATNYAGPNLLPNTFQNEVQYLYPASSYSDKFTKRTIDVVSGSQYILSFFAKSTVAGDKVRAHYYNPNTTTRGESSQGVVSTANDGNIDFTLSTEWTFYWVKYTQSATTSSKIIIFPRMLSTGGTGTVSVKCVKLEEGTVPTPWVPASTDSIYVADHSSMFEIDDLCKIHKNGNIQASEFIET